MADIPEDLQQRIAAYIDGQLPPAEAARLEVFLANTDPALADSLVSMLTDKVQLKALPKPRAPVDLAARIMEQVERGSLLRDVENLGGQRRPWWQSRGAIAAGLVIVLGGFTYFVVSSVIRPVGRAPQIASVPPGPRESEKATRAGSAAPADAARLQRNTELAAGEPAVAAKEGSTVTGATLAASQTFAQADAPVAKSSNMATVPLPLGSSLSLNSAQMPATMPAGTVAMEATSDNISRQLSSVTRDSSSSAAPIIITLRARDDQDFNRLQATLGQYAGNLQRGQALAGAVESPRAMLAIQTGESDPRAGVRNAAAPNAANQSLGQIAAGQAQAANPAQQQNAVSEAQSTYSVQGIGGAGATSGGNLNFANGDNVALNGNGVLTFNQAGPAGNARNPAANNFAGTTNVNGGVLNQNIGGGSNTATGKDANNATNLYQDQNLSNRASPSNTNSKLEAQNFGYANNSAVQQAVARGGPYRVTLTYEQLQELSRTYHVSVLARGNEAYFFREGDRMPPTVDVRERTDLARRAGFENTESAGGPALAGGRGGRGEPSAPRGLSDAKTSDALAANDKAGTQSLDSAAREKDEAALQPTVKSSAAAPATVPALAGSAAPQALQKSANTSSPILFECIITMEPPAPPATNR